MICCKETLSWKSMIISTYLVELLQVLDCERYHRPQSVLKPECNINNLNGALIIGATLSSSGNCFWSRTTAICFEDVRPSYLLRFVIMVLWKKEVIPRCSQFIHGGIAHFKVSVSQQGWLGLLGWEEPFWFGTYWNLWLLAVTISVGLTDE